MDTPAHDKEVTIRFIERWQAHAPRKGDPNYKYFNQAKTRMKKLGLLKCAIDSNHHSGDIELHHSKLEFAHIEDVDLSKFNEAYGLHLDDASFQQFIEGEGNLEPLCREHHRGVSGIHSLPEPEWNALRVAKSGVDIVSVESNNLIPVDKR